MTYTTLLLEMAQKMQGLTLREDRTEHGSKLFLFYDGDLIYEGFHHESEKAYADAFHELVNNGIKMLLFREGVFSSLDTHQ